MFVRYLNVMCSVITLTVISVKKSLELQQTHMAAKDSHCVIK